MAEHFRTTLSMTAVVIMSLLLTSLLLGQESTIEEGAGMGWGILGFQTFDTEALNSTLENNTYSAFSDKFFTVGGGGQGIIKRVILGGEGYALLGETSTQGNRETSIAGGAGFFNLGYVALSTKTLRMYPLLGIGGGAIGLRIFEKSEGLSFEDVLKDPKRSVELTTGGLLLNLSLGADYLIIMEENEEGAGGLIFGLRIGYTVAPIKGDWMMDDLTVSDGPELGMTGPFIRLMIGGGGHGPRR